MQTWSDSPIHPNFSVKFFIDTNILIYLVDNTYQSLTDFIDISKDCKFVELVSSKYVIFEFIGVRKREHYLRKVVSASKLSSKGEVNFGSLLNYQNSFSAPGVPFETVIPNIKTDIDLELQDISVNYKINYEFSTLHSDQLHPTSEICLATKLANQDCLVLISAILPQPGIVSENLQVLTNDGDFIKFFEEANIDHVFTPYNTTKPALIGIDKILGEARTVINLKSVMAKADIETHIKSVIIRLLIEKNKALFLGKTIIPTSATFPSDVIPFKFNLNQSVPENVYITVVSKDLDFIYTTRKKIAHLQHNGTELVQGHQFTDEAKNKVAYKLTDVSDTGIEIPVDAAIINAIRVEGNFVFTHPDS
jgi:hypothetical protein